MCITVGAGVGFGVGNGVGYGVRLLIIFFSKKIVFFFFSQFFTCGVGEGVGDGVGAPVGHTLTNVGYICGHTLPDCRRQKPEFNCAPATIATNTYDYDSKFN